MKLKRILTLCCMLTMALGMASSASAADYSFETSANPVYYGSTNYEDLYDAGYNYGARKPDRVKKTIKCAMFYAEAIMLVGFLLFQFLPDKLLGLFSASEAMLAIGKPALRIICFHFLLAGMSIILSSTFQALGNGMFSLIISVCRQLVVLLPAAWLLSKTGNVNMVWWSFVIAELVSVTLSFVFFARLDKKIIEPMYDNAAAAQ